MTRLLFITWDGPQTNYLESLFFPIFDVIRQQVEVEIHVIQFTWGDIEKNREIKELAIRLGFQYVAIDVNHELCNAWDAFCTIWKGSGLIRQYIAKNQIEIVMPRSTMPAMMINLIRGLLKNIKIIFDADGLPLEERVDFSGLKKSSLQYKILKWAETTLLRNADAVITRSQKAIDIHLNNIGKRCNYKFFKVINGRSAHFFSPNNEIRDFYRARLDIKPDEILFVYCGSLGPQYGWNEMLKIFSQYFMLDKNSKFLILTNSPSFLEGKIPLELKQNIIVKSVPFESVPNYLNASDIAFAIRQPSYSMQGIAPIKLGEYMLMKLPTIASKGIGDTEELIPLDSCFLYDHKDPKRVEKVIDWCKSVHLIDKNKIREVGMAQFSLNRSVESYMNVINYTQTSLLRTSE